MQISDTRSAVTAATQIPIKDPRDIVPLLEYETFWASAHTMRADPKVAIYPGERAHILQFFSTRQLSPAAFRELHTRAAAFIDVKGPIDAR